MSRFLQHLTVFSACLAATIFAAGCGANTQVSVNTANSNVANANTNANASNANVATASAMPDFNEPDSYQGLISLTLEAVGEQTNASMPPLQAVVARSGNDRALQFALPSNEKIIYLEKGDMNYVVLPSRKQYAELTQEALGFEVRRLMMPEQIVQQLKSVQGVQFAGEETVNGRVVQKYVYGATAETGTQAGTVTTESYFLIDKETSLPVRSTISSQSTSGGSVQGMKGVRLVTEMKDLKTDADATMFEVPAGYAKIDPEQVKAQANLLFNAAAAVVGQLINQAKTEPSPAANNSPAANR